MFVLGKLRFTKFHFRVQLIITACSSANTVDANVEAS